jgi:hypothetical protein
MFKFEYVILYYEVITGSFEPIYAKKHLFCILSIMFETWNYILGSG